MCIFVSLPEVHHFVLQFSTWEGSDKNPLAWRMVGCLKMTWGGFFIYLFSKLKM